MGLYFARESYSIQRAIILPIKLRIRLFKVSIFSDDYAHHKSGHKGALATSTTARQRERQKIGKKKKTTTTTLHVHHASFVHFFAVTARPRLENNCLISRFVEEVNTRQRLSFSFPEL